MIILRNKPERFNKIKQLMTGVSANMLTVCLRELERDRLIIKDDSTYALTEEATKIVDLMLEIKTILETL